MPGIWLGRRCGACPDRLENPGQRRFEAMVAASSSPISARWRPVLVMSNGGFGGIHQRLPTPCRRRAETSLWQGASKRPSTGPVCEAAGADYFSASRWSRRRASSGRCIRIPGSPCARRWWCAPARWPCRPPSRVTSPIRYRAGLGNDLHMVGAEGRGVDKARLDLRGDHHVIASRCQRGDARDLQVAGDGPYVGERLRRSGRPRHGSRHQALRRRAARCD